MFPLKFITAFFFLFFYSSGIFSLELAFPLQCKVGDDCHVQYYVDHDPGPAVQDYQCGGMSAPKQKGTSIRLADTNEMIKGFEVLAASSGDVISIQNSIPDQVLNDQVKQNLKGQECGNNVVIDHGSGWITQYCHMMRGSVIVVPGEGVKGGQPLGLLGLSGFTTYPHLEFILKKDDQFVDPFHSAAGGSQCGENINSLWMDPEAIPYPDSQVISSSFSETIPQLKEVVLGKHHPAFLPHTIKRLVFWVQIIGAKKGDVHSIIIYDQRGRIIAQSVKNVLSASQPVGIFSIVHEIGSGKFAPGLYKGGFVVERDVNGEKKVIEQHNNQIVLQ